MLRRLSRNTLGSSTVDFAFALPVLAVVTIATLQAGQVLHARGSLRHAVGEGVRLAKVNPGATQSEVITLVKAELPSLNESRLSNLTFSRGRRMGRISPP